MDKMILEIERLFQDKILLFRELIDVLKQEKKYIVEADVDSLWRLSDDKQRLFEEITEIRAAILDQLQQNGISHSMNANTFNMTKVISLIPKSNLNIFDKLRISLVCLHDEAHALSSHNKHFVTEYLTILDELMGSIFKLKKPDTSYRKSPYTKSAVSREHMLLHKEV